MNKVRQTAKKYLAECIVFFILSIIFFVTRTYNLTDLPIFTDEAIYLRWAQIASNDPQWRFISLTDGKQPLFIWFVVVAMRFIEDLLLAGRIVSVISGFASMVGLFFIGRELFRNRWIGITCALLYLIFPMALVYDRVALYDSLVGTISIWSLYFSILLVRKLQLDIALVLGMVIGAGVLNKSIGFFSIYLLPVTLFLFDWRKQNRIKRFCKWIFFAAVAAFSAFAYYSLLRLSPFFYIVEEKNALFVYPFKEWIMHPFTFFWGNLSVGQWNWLHTYMTWPILLLAAISFFISKEYTRQKLFLLAWFLIPFLSLALFGKVLYPRFVFFMILALLSLSAFSLQSIFFAINKRKLLFAGIFFLSIFLAIRSDYAILTDFSRAPIPKSDLGQLINDWPAGGGVKEAVEFFKKQAENQKIFISTQGTFGLMPYSIEIYLVSNPNVEIVGFWPTDEEMPEKLKEVARKKPTYIVFYQPCPACPNEIDAPPKWPVELVARYRKGIGKRYLSIYQVTPK